MSKVREFAGKVYIFDRMAPQGGKYCTQTAGGRVFIEFAADSAKARG